MRESQREQTPGPDGRRPGFTGLRQALNSGLAFFALCALLMGVVWAVNAPTVKADPPPSCGDVAVCNETAPCNTVCTDPELQRPSTCLFYGVCASSSPTPDPYRCSDVCTTSTSCDTTCNLPDTGIPTTCGAWGVCAASSCNPSSCQTQCCAAGCAAKPTFSVSATTINTGESVTFTMTSPQTDPNDCAWNFGDGTPEVWNQGQVTHTYSTAGFYQARVVAGDLVCEMWLGSELATINVVTPGGGPPGGCKPKCKDDE